MYITSISRYWDRNTEKRNTGVDAVIIRLICNGNWLDEIVVRVRLKRIFRGLSYYAFSWWHLRARIRSLSRTSKPKLIWNAALWFSWVLANELLSFSIWYCPTPYESISSRSKTKKHTCSALFTNPVLFERAPTVLLRRENFLSDLFPIHWQPHRFFPFSCCGIDNQDHLGSYILSGQHLKQRWQKSGSSTTNKVIAREEKQRLTREPRDRQKVEVLEVWTLQDTKFFMNKPSLFFESSFHIPCVAIHYFYFGSCSYTLVATSLANLLFCVMKFLTFSQV